MTDEDTIEVITTMPNRYSSLKNEAEPYEKQGNLAIHRIAIPAHKNGFIDQIYAFSVYWMEVQRLVKNQSYDLIYACSARLFTGFLGAKIARRKSIKLYLDIRDILSDTLSDVIKNRLLKAFLLPIVTQIERYTVTSANHLNLVSEGFRNEFNYFKGPITFFTNGIDKIFLETDFENKDVNHPLVITYAGNIGEGQGLEKIIPEIAQRLSGKYVFNIIGDGSTRYKLVSKLQELAVENVQIIAPVRRSELLRYYQKSDFLFLHLNNYQAFEKVLPSKIFEYGATQKPIMAGVNGYAKDFIQKHLPESLIFEPASAESFLEALRNFEPHVVSRELFTAKFNRERIMENMAEDLLRLVEQTGRFMLL
jgi:hypothetical protein